MKKKILILLNGVLLTNAFCQGTVEFANIHTGSPLNAPVYQSDGITRLAGQQFLAQLLGGPSANSLAPVALTGFLTGNGAGYFLGGSVGISAVPYGSVAWMQVDVWSTASGASFAEAQSSGLPNSWWQSSIFSVITGNPFGTPTPPAVLTGLGTSPVFLNGAAVPEPSALALGFVGAVVALFRVRYRS